MCGLSLYCIKYSLNLLICGESCPNFFDIFKYISKKVITSTPKTFSILYHTTAEMSIVLLDVRRLKVNIIKVKRRWLALRYLSSSCESHSLLSYSTLTLHSCFPFRYFRLPSPFYKYIISQLFSFVNSF